MSTPESRPPGLDSERSSPGPARNLCRICGQPSDGVIMHVREMMLGLRDSFRYMVCDACGTIQIETLPEDLGRYYPDGYYSKNVVEQPLIVRLLKRKRADATLGLPTITGFVLRRVFGPAPIATWVKQCGAAKTDRILDVGCGSGHNLLELSNIGFQHLQGVDPYVKADMVVGSGVSIKKAEIGSVEGEFDLIMINHVLEHVSDPERMLTVAGGLLSSRGKILIRTPIAGSYAWRTYGVDWVQLDAPRHLHVFSERSIALLANRVGLRVDSVEYDSDEFQFWGSEQYRADISLSEPESFQNAPNKSLFSKSQIREYRILARDLNENRDGDQASFVLSSTVDGQ